MTATIARQQYANLSRDIKFARKAEQWGLVKHLQKKQTALKPLLIGETSNVETSTTPQHASNTLSKLRSKSRLRDSTEAKPTTKGSPRILPFNFYCVPGSENTRNLTSKVFTLWTEHHTFQRMISAERLQGYKTIIDGVIANVLYADITKHAGVRVSREQSSLGSESRYRPTAFNRRVLTVIDDLHEMGVINQIRGERWGKNYAKVFGIKNTPRPTTKQTELHTTDLLKQLAASCNVTRLEDFTFQTDRQEVVILKKDKSSSLVEYEDTPQTEKLRMQVKRINRMLEHAGDLLATGAHTVHDQRQRFLVRKFTYGSLESGGRLSGGFWMGMKKIERPQLLRINGEKTVEIDYKAVMTHIACIVADEPTPPQMADLYAIPGLSPASRPGIKKFLSALYFKNSLPTKFPQGVGEKLTPEDRAKGCAYVLRQIQKAHEGIHHLFGTGIGHYLQHLESKVMVNVLLRCTVMGMTALPIHDCLIVGESYKGRAIGIMETVSRMVLGRGIPCEEKISDEEDLGWMDEDEDSL